MTPSEVALNKLDNPKNSYSEENHSINRYILSILYLSGPVLGIRETSSTLHFNGRDTANTKMYISGGTK